ncbi:uncharacterized protein LOC126838662 [Adelges cooleyi]|uniref:uncharacterized protein LOC126838662 n=1 Tax=Adelges cooleyi TaxID=133065 RepID=UPI00217F8778|nr:uncharacterized protein LOC126838662 [Adelges cooleyi]
MAHLLFPPDLSTINKYQYDYFDWEIVENEIRIQRVISDIYDTKIEVDTENKDFKDDEIEVDIENKDFKDDEIEVDFENTDFKDDEIEVDFENTDFKDDEIEVDFENTDFKDSFKMYERALDIRKRLLLPVMQRLLYNILDSEKMCCTDSGMKCRLVALMIQCSDNRRLIKNATCKNKMCIISETVQDEENHKKSQTDEHTFYDVEKNDSFYTYFVDRNGIDKPWIEIVFD